MNKPNWIAKTLLILLSSLVAVSIFLFGLELANANRIAWGIKAAGINLGGLKTEQAISILKEELRQFQDENFRLVLSDQNQTWSVSVKDLGLDFDLQKTADQAYRIGRGKNVLSGLGQQIKAFFGGYNIILQTKLNHEKFDKFTTLTFSSFEDPAQSASLSYSQQKDNFEIVPSQDGSVVDRKKLIEDLSRSISHLAFPEIDLSLVKDYPQVTNKHAQETKQEALMILAYAPYSLVYQDKAWPLERKIILEWISFESAPDKLSITLKKSEIEPFLLNLAPGVNQASVNAILGSENDLVIIVKASQDAIEIDVEQTYLRLSEIINSRQKKIQVAIKSVPAPIRQETLQELGLINLLGAGSSNYAGSSRSRIHNIKIGIAKMNGYLMSPGEEFSFTTELEEVTASSGYLPEMVIKRNKLIPEYGGGLCQVSTTMFRAIVYSGLETTERNAHAFAVGYYNPPGFDSTIYQPHPDLRFINDTPNNILIQGYTSSTKAYFEFYGTSDGRRTEVDGPYTYESNPDGSMKTVLTQTVYRDEEVLREKKFWSNYKSPALYPVERNPLE